MQHGVEQYRQVLQSFQTHKVFFCMTGRRGDTDAIITYIVFVSGMQVLADDVGRRQYAFNWGN